MNGYLGNTWVDFSWTRLCFGLVLDDGYWALYVGPLSFIRPRKVKVSVR